jgi:hypothetical protein
MERGKFLKSVGRINGYKESSMSFCNSRTLAAELFRRSK